MSTDAGGSATQPVAGARFCYRHPDRETYISCQRCSRPICPDCMTPASVGFHCPDCVREGQASVRQPRTMAGGMMPDSIGLVTKVLIGLNVLVFVLGFLDQGLDRDIGNYGAMIGATEGYFVAGFPAGVAEGGYWRLLTAAFIHGGLIHVLFNMYALSIFGPLLEQAFGRARFIAFYLTSAVASSAVVYVLTDPYTGTVGASGAVFALFGAAIVLSVRQRMDPKPLLVLLAINGVITFAIPGISWQGHLGGLLTGLLLGAALLYAPRAHRTLWQGAAFGAVALAVLVMVLARTAALTG